MKLGVTGFPPMTFRLLSMLMGLPLLLLVVRAMKVRLTIPRRHWPELTKLALTNMVFWHAVAIIAIEQLSSGRAAILGYTMPMFSAVWGFALFGQRLAPRQLVGVAAAFVGAGLLLWHELARLSGSPLAVFAMLATASVWALGTQQLRRTRIEQPVMAITFWMTVISTGVLCMLTAALESTRWHAPPPTVWWAAGYNALGVFAIAQPAWFYLARSLPPAASTLSTMMIPVLGVLSGAYFLREQLHWQDGAAVVLMMVAIATVLWPARAARLGAGQTTGETQRS
jgi:drug/metabolite transporter (DMT)-like permease